MSQWFDRLVGKWIATCEQVGIDVDSIERAKQFIDGEAYTPADKKPPALAALLSWYMDASQLCREDEPPPDELMGSELWQLISLCETAYYMGRADAVAEEPVPQ